MPYAWRASPQDRTASAAVAPALPSWRSRQATLLAAGVSVTSGVLGLFAFPLVLGPVAILASVVAMLLAARDGGPAGLLGSAGLVVGLLVLMVAVSPA